MLRKTRDYLPYAFPYLLVTAMSLLLFYPTWLRLIGQWLAFEQVLAHGLFTALIFIGLLLVHPPRVPANASPTRRLWPSGLLLLAVVSAWGVLELVRIDTLTALLMPIGLGSLAWVFLGNRAARAFIPYLLLLALSLPVWADLVPSLVRLASAVVNNTVHAFGLTVLVEGNSISLPYGRLVIADGCSGIRYLAISILLGALVSILNDARPRDWAITLAMAALLGLIANWVRIIILVVVGYQSQMQSGLLTDHETMGWLVFAAFVLPALYFSPVRRRSHESLPTTPPAVRQRGLIPLALAALAGPVTVAMANAYTPETQPWALSAPGLVIANPQRLPIALTYPDTFDHTTWQTTNTYVSVAQAEKRSADDKLVPYFHPPIQSNVWQLERTSGDGLRIYRNVYSRQQVLVWQWYRVGEYEAGSYRAAKLWQIPAMFQGYRRFAAVTMEQVCVQQDCALAEAAARALRHRMALLPMEFPGPEAGKP